MLAHSRTMAGLLAFGLLLLSETTFATTINGITLTDENIFRDFRGINDVGIAQGDNLQFGGSIAGGSAGAFGAGIFTPTGATTPSINQSLGACGPLAVNPNFCARSTPYTTTVLDGTWQFKVQDGGATAVFALPPASLIPVTPVPFPSNVTISNSANGIQPTINWTLPAGYTPDGFRVQIFDLSSIRANGGADIIHSATLSPTATSYTFPTTLSSGAGTSLILGHQYAINFQVIETRTGQPKSPAGNADILTRSNSFFDFTPQLGGTVPDNIALPQVDGVTGVYHFTIDKVVPTQ